ncbi:MAG TPA: hypothetical protein VMW87_04645 [Spirochaetia bacterium]|nr:hypothetical protein [Spirochaetia bacterium]
MGEICASCGKGDAVIKIQTIMGPVTEDLWLCRSCAEKHGIDPEEPAIEPRTADLLSGLLRPRSPKRRKKPASGGQSDKSSGAASSGGSAAVRREGSSPGDDLGVERAAQDGRECPNCGMTIARLKKTGRVGCVNCYAVFRPIIETVLKDQSFAGRHIGRLPEKLQRYRYIFVERERLSRGLAAAVVREDYEEAARIREEIHRLDRTEGIADDIE